MPPVLRTEAVALAHRGSYLYVLELAGVHVVAVEHDGARLDDGVLRYEIRWRVD
jgi:hypothetical protein